MRVLAVKAPHLFSGSATTIRELIGSVNSMVLHRVYVEISDIILREADFPGRIRSRLIDHLKVTGGMGISQHL
jgi:hypothetical protein